MQTGILLAVDRRSHAFRLAAKSCVVAVVAQVNHLVLESIVHVFREMGVIDA
jgi:hypothetical protein